MALLDQLQTDHTKITAILKAHYEGVESPKPTDAPVGVLYQVYIESLQDALKTLDSLMDILQKQT